MGAEKGWQEAVVEVLEEKGGLDEWRKIKEERVGERSRKRDGWGRRQGKI